jgi:2,4-dienoyl-CoA reductase (NADPH2)
MSFSISYLLYAATFYPFFKGGDAAEGEAEVYDETASPAEAVSDQASVKAFFKHWGVDTSHTERGGVVAAPPPAVPGGGGGGGGDGSQRREVFLLQRKKGKPGAGLGKTTGWIHRAELTKAGVHMQGGVKE